MEEERERKTAHARRDKPFGKYASTILPDLITNPTRLFIGHFSFYTIFLIVATKRSHHQHKEKEYKTSFEKFDSFFFNPLIPSLSNHQLVLLFTFYFLVSIFQIVFFLVLVFVLVLVFHLTFLCF